MKFHFALFTLVACTCLVYFLEKTAISDEETHTPEVTSEIRLDGPREETVYLHTFYEDPGAEIMNEVNGELRCSGNFLKGKGNLNMNVSGIYFLNYAGEDHRGHPLPVVTRTIHVVENEAAFLNGVYNVACSCTAVIGSSAPSVSTDNYLATVSPGSKSYRFELNTLKISTDNVIPITRLIEKNGMEVHWISDVFDPARSFASGTLSPEGNGFTIESIAVKSFPYESYRCRNVFTSCKREKDLP